jgi:16S rRNA (guanine(966)-N(2))-methyltransferase RsmD
MPMRIIGGEARGRTLRGPPRDGVRPTSDRVREALFEILASHDVDLSRVLDLYSGTGALGIEALSRGAGHCDFVEADTKTCDVIRENLARTRTLDRARVYPMPVARAVGRLQGPYSLVVADPPYEYDRAEKELTELLESGQVAESGIVAVEHSKRHEWPEELASKPQMLNRRYGDTALTLYQ